MNFSLLLKYITPHRISLLYTLGFLLTGSILSLANPWMAGLITSSALGDPKYALSITTLLGIWGILFVLRSAIGFAGTYQIGTMGERVTTDLRSRLYKHLQSLPLAYYQQRRPGQTLSLISTDAEVISRFITDTLVQLLPALLTFGGAFIMMVWLDGTLALFALVLLPAYFIVMKVVGRRMRPLSKAWIEANSNMFSVLEENLSLLPAIKAFTRERFEQRRFGTVNNELLDITRRQILAEAALSASVGLLGGLALILFLSFGASQVENGQLQAAELVSLLLYAMLMMNPLRTLANVYGQLQQTRGAADRIIKFLQQSQEPGDHGSAQAPAFRGHIEYDKVSFAYPGRKNVLSDLSFKISAGETIALTGENGIGKTTIAQLLLRFCEPEHGLISIDGLDIRTFTLSSLRKQIGLVAQHVLLLNGSIAENIAYSQPDTPQVDIERAAKAAHAHEFITALPQGYQTTIGDHGVRLSGGQRQRLSLARTLLMDPAIIILDEATAMFDPTGERAFVQECHSALSDKTVILITHRPASLQLADRILKLTDQGISE